MLETSSLGSPYVELRPVPGIVSVEGTEPDSSKNDSAADKLQVPISFNGPPPF